MFAGDIRRRRRSEDRSSAAPTIGVLRLPAGVGFRRLRYPLLLVGTIAIGYFAQDLKLLTVKAFPTGFYTAQSIARGADLFAVYCAVCHGMEGRGNGPASKDLAKKPANLASHHTYAHTDGDLFGWITNGVGELMPGFGVDLDEDARWSLVDFIRANADATHIRGLVTSAAFPAPEFSAACPNGSTISLGDLRGRIIHLVLAGSRSAEHQRQLPKLDLGKDVTTIIIPLDASTAVDTTVCVATDPDVIKAFALYRNRDAGQLERTEMLVDAFGSLHSIWYPGIDWNDTDMLKRRIEEIRQTPASPRSWGP